MKILMRFPGGLPKTFTMSYDDGVFDDVRLIEIMKKNGVRGTFNVNTGRWNKNEADPGPKKITYDMAKQIYLDNGMELATHSVTHPFLEQLPVANMAYEILQDKITLEEKFKTVIRGHAYPYGTWSPEVVKTLKQCGIVYARTTEVTGKFNVPNTADEWLTLASTAKHTDKNLFELGKRFADAADKNKPMMFYLWGHSFEFNKEHDDNWEVIEKFLEYIGGRDDIWYATNIEIYDYVQAYQSLQFSATCDRVYNPTATTVWFRSDLGLHKVEPAQTIEIG